MVGVVVIGRVYGGEVKEVIFGLFNIIIEGLL